MASPTDLLNRRISGASPREERGQFPSIYEGEVVSVAGEFLNFRILDYSHTIEFGPAHYPRPPLETELEGGGSGDSSFAEHSHVLRTPAEPPVGVGVIVCFVQGDPNRPEVLKVKGWWGA